jgi:hypothetical protein
VHVISGVSGEGINTVLRAMAREVNRRRVQRAEDRHFARPAPVPRTRSERQTVNFNAPVVPKARIAPPQPAAAPVTVKTPMAKAKAKAARKLGNAKVKKAAVKPKAKLQTGRAKAKPRPMSKTAQRTKKKQRR